MSRLLLSLLASLVLCSCARWKPDGFAREFLQASAEGDWRAVREMVTEECADSPMAHGAPVMSRGLGISARRLDVSVVSETEEAATIAYEIEGRLISGADFNVRGGSLSQDEPNAATAVRSGNLFLVKVDGRWRVTCP